MFSPNVMTKYYTRGLKRKQGTPTNQPPINPFKIITGANKDNGSDGSDDDDDHAPFKFPILGQQDSDVYTQQNHIYFKTDVTEESIDKLANEIDHLNRKLTSIKQNKTTYGTFTPKPILLHITTRGGDLLAGLFAFDKIRNSKVPIHTIIEGQVASAGSIMSIAGKRRYITPNSHVLIHQLRTGMFGTFEELKDEKQNCTNLMNRIVNLYYENCNGKMNKTKIRDILKRDLYWDAKTAKSHGIIDEVWNDGCNADDAE